jgi:hypothetical protein
MPKSDLVRGTHFILVLRTKAYFLPLGDIPMHSELYTNWGVSSRDRNYFLGVTT